MALLGRSYFLLALVPLSHNRESCNITHWGRWLFMFGYLSRCIRSTMLTLEPGLALFNLTHNFIAFGIAATDLLHLYEIIINFQYFLNFLISPYSHAPGGWR